jgi:hypothetical protein
MATAPPKPHIRDVLDAVTKRTPQENLQQAKLLKIPEDALVGIWLWDELRRKGVVHQQDAAAQIRKSFGRQFLYQTDTLNSGIRSNVLHYFRRFAKGRARWNLRRQRWTRQGK